MSEEREPYLTQHQAEIAVPLCAPSRCAFCFVAYSELKEITTYHPVMVQSYEQRLAELETERRELLTVIDQLESERRAAAQRYNQFKEAAWSVLSVDQALSDDAESDRFELALRHLAALVNFPTWW